VVYKSEGKVYNNSGKEIAYVNQSTNMIIDKVTGNEVGPNVNSNLLYDCDFTDPEKGTTDSGEMDSGVGGAPYIHTTISLIVGILVYALVINQEGASEQMKHLDEGLIYGILTAIGGTGLGSLIRNAEEKQAKEQEREKEREKEKEKEREREAEKKKERDKIADKKRKEDEKKVQEAIKTQQGKKQQNIQPNKLIQNLRVDSNKVQKVIKTQQGKKQQNIQPNELIQNLKIAPNKVNEIVEIQNRKEEQKQQSLQTKVVIKKLEKTKIITKKMEESRLKQENLRNGKRIVIREKRRIKEHFPEVQFVETTTENIVDKPKVKQHSKNEDVNITLEESKSEVEILNEGKEASYIEKE